VPAAEGDADRRSAKNAAAPLPRGPGDARWRWVSVLGWVGAPGREVHIFRRRPGDDGVDVASVGLHDAELETPAWKSKQPASSLRPSGDQTGLKNSNRSLGRRSTCRPLGWTTMIDPALGAAADSVQLVALVVDTGDAAKGDPAAVGGEHWLDVEPVIGELPGAGAVGAHDPDGSTEVRPERRGGVEGDPAAIRRPFGDFPTDRTPAQCLWIHRRFASNPRLGVILVYVAWACASRSECSFPLSFAT
jgi:hypothetical protein